MSVLRRHDAGLIDVCYLVVLAVAMVNRQSAQPLSVGMALFALLVVVVNWTETRRLLDTVSGEPTAQAVTAGGSVLLLVVWYVLATRPADELAQFFGLLAFFFGLQAVRDTAVLGLSPVALFSRGYVNLVAVYLVFGATADAVDRFRLGLLSLAVLIYLVRTGYRYQESRDETNRP